MTDLSLGLDKAARLAVQFGDRQKNLDGSLVGFQMKLEAEDAIFQGESLVISATCSCVRF